MPSNILIYGGSFDPVHNGHLYPLKDLLLNQTTGKVIFVPCYQQPLKGKSNISAQQRLHLLQLALENVEISNTSISDIEIQRKGKSYTFDTLIYFKNKYPKSRLSFVVGMDSLYSLHKWHNWQQILEMSTLLVMNRGGQAFEESKADNAVLSHLDKNIKLVKTQSLEISSTDIRELLAQKKYDTLRSMMPGQVLDYLVANNLYLS